MHTIDTTAPQPKLFRGRTNNGMHTVLTEEAARADENRKAAACFNGTYDGTEELADITAAGTFTFVEGMHPYDRGYVTGTLADLDAWSTGLVIGTYSGSNYVPFSNGRNRDERDCIRTAAEVIWAFGLQLWKQAQSLVYVSNTCCFGVLHQVAPPPV